MSFLVATLLLYMDEFEAFKCLANLLGRRCALLYPLPCRNADAVLTLCCCFRCAG